MQISILAHFYYFFQQLLQLISLKKNAYLNSILSWELDFLICKK